MILTKIGTFGAKMVTTLQEPCKQPAFPELKRKFRDILTESWTLPFVFQQINTTSSIIRHITVVWSHKFPMSQPARPQITQLDMLTDHSAVE